MKISDKQAGDAGLALAFIASLLAWLGGYGWALPATAAVILALMVKPSVFRPFGVVWFGLSHVLGTVMSKILLSVIFFLLVTPVGLFRRMAGADPMRLKQFKAGTDSVFTVRDHELSAADLEKMF